MKKILCCLIASVVLIMCLTPCCVSAEGSTVSEIYETFENDASEWNLKAGTVREVLEGKGHDGGDCILTSTPTTENFHLTKGKIYRVSGWVKIDSALPSSAIKDGGQNFRLQWYHNGDAAAGVNFRDVAKMTLKYTLNQWQYFEHDFWLANANGFTTNEITTSVFLQIMDAGGQAFWLDDYAVTILGNVEGAFSYTGNQTKLEINDENEKNMRLVKNGNFEDAYVAGDWTASNTVATPTYFGAENTMTALNLDMDANGTFGQNVATVNGSEYAGILYTKQAENDTADISILANGTPVSATTEAVAGGWTKYTFDYTATGATVFLVTSDADSVFSIDEFSIEPKAAVTSLYAENVKVTGKLLPGEQVTFDWGYSINHTGRTIIKVYKGANDTWTVTDYVIAQGGATSYSVPVLTDEDVGKKLKIEILPIDAPQGKTVKCIYYETSAVKKTFDINIYNFVQDSTSVTATVGLTNFVAGKDVLVTICLYDAKNALIDYDSAYIPSVENTVISDTVSCAKTADSAYARVFIWGGTDIDSSDMSSLKEVSELDLN